MNTAEPEAIENNHQDPEAEDVGADRIQRCGNDRVDQLVERAQGCAGEYSIENAEQNHGNRTRDNAGELSGYHRRNLFRKLDDNVVLLAELENVTDNEGNDNACEQTGSTEPADW